MITLLSSNTKVFRVGMLLSAFLCLFSSARNTQAAVIADFAGGQGTSQPDQYKGKIGMGWEGGWGERLDGEENTEITVANDNPLFTDSGNYLNISYVRADTSETTRRFGVARKFSNVESAGGINVNAPYTISFDLRVDSLSGWNADSDQISVTSETTSAFGSVGLGVPWALTIRGDNGWNVGIGDGTGSGGKFKYLNFTGLGLDSLATNVVYSITVFIYPQQKGYDLTITTHTATPTTYRASDLNEGNLLGFRGSEGDAVNARLLSFRASMGTAGDSVSMSLDNVVVSSIPEPSSIVLLGCVFSWAVSLVALRKKRRKAGNHPPD